MWGSPPGRPPPAARRAPRPVASIVSTKFLPPAPNSHEERTMRWFGLAAAVACSPASLERPYSWTRRGGVGLHVGLARTAVEDVVGGHVEHALGRLGHVASALRVHGVGGLGGVLGSVHVGVRGAVDHRGARERLARRAGVGHVEIGVGQRDGRAPGRPHDVLTEHAARSHHVDRHAADSSPAAPSSRAPEARPAARSACASACPTCAPPAARTRWHRAARRRARPLSAAGSARARSPCRRSR